MTVKSWLSSTFLLLVESNFDSILFGSEKLKKKSNLSWSERLKIYGSCLEVKDWKNLLLVLKWKTGKIILLEFPTIFSSVTSSLWIIMGLSHWMKHLGAHYCIYALFVLQPILYSYFRSSCSWRVRTGEWKESLSGAPLDRFKTQQRLKFLWISSTIMSTY